MWLVNETAPNASQATSSSFDSNSTAPADRGWAATFAALHYRNYRLLWITTLFISGGNWIQQVTLGWLVFDITRSPVKVGIVLGLRALPMLTAPLSGVLADRFDRRRLLLFNQSGLALVASIFAVVILTGNLEEWHFYVFSFLTGVGWSMNNPIRQSLVANSVPPNHLMNAIALNSMAFNSMRMIGPGVGGALIQFFGPGMNFLIQAALYVCVCFLMAPYRAEYTSRRENPRAKSPLADLAEGFKHIAGDRIASFAIILSLVPTVSMMAFLTTLMPVYAVELGYGEGGGVGLLMMAMGVGGFIGTLIVARLSFFERKGLMVIVGVAGAGVALLALSQVHLLWLAMVVLVVQQLFFIMVMTTNNTILQTVTPDELRGRVMGVYMLDVGMQPAGGLVAGFIASGVGVSTAWMVGSIVGLIAVASVASFAKTFRNLRI